jgi:hypothetical protein
MTSKSTKTNSQRAEARTLPEVRITSKTARFFLISIELPEKTPEWKGNLAKLFLYIKMQILSNWTMCAVLVFLL